jgi:Calcineurin-like phosphoesterase
MASSSSCSSSSSSDDARSLQTIEITATKFQVFGCSDLHADSKENRELFDELTKPHIERRMSGSHESCNSVLLIAGDISLNLERCEATLSRALDAFDSVFFVPGNNELRLIKSKSSDEFERGSFDKFDRVLALCTRLGVHVGPVLFTNAERELRVAIVPLVAWYSATFTGRWKRGDSVDYQRSWLDFRRCRFHGYADDESQEGVARHFAELNEPVVDAVRSHRPAPHTVITMSHFLPLPSLVPLLAKWRRPDIQYVLGSPFLDAQLRRLGSTTHLYGHSHVNGDSKIDSVRYVQNAMGHPRERHSWWRSSNYQFKCILSK